MCMDVKDFYLNTPMDRYKYMWIPVAMLSPEVIEAYDLKRQNQVQPGPGQDSKRHVWPPTSQPYRI